MLSIVWLNAFGSLADSALIAEARLKKTDAYKAYLNELQRTNSKKALNAVSSQGLIGYLLSGEEE